MAIQHDEEFHGSAVGVEPDYPPNRRLFVLIGVLAVALVFIALGVSGVVKYLTLQEQLRQNAVPGFGQNILAEVHATDSKLLYEYDVIDAANRVYQIPIDRAVDKLLKNPGLLGAIPNRLPTPTQP